MPSSWGGGGSKGSFQPVEPPSERQGARYRNISSTVRGVRAAHVTEGGRELTRAATCSSSLRCGVRVFDKHDFVNRSSMAAGAVALTAAVGQCAGNDDGVVSRAPAGWHRDRMNPARRPENRNLLYNGATSMEMSNPSAKPCRGAPAVSAATCGPAELRRGRNARRRPASL